MLDLALKELSATRIQIEILKGYKELEILRVK